MKRLLTGIFVYCYVCTTIYAATTLTTEATTAANTTDTNTTVSQVTNPPINTADPASSTLSTAEPTSSPTNAPDPNTPASSTNNPGVTPNPAAPTTTAAPTTPKPKTCKQGECTGNISCIAKTCTLTENQSCIQNITTTRLNDKVTTGYKFDCIDSCEPLSQTGSPGENSTTTVTKCCSEDLCNEKEIPEQNNSAITMTACVVMYALGIVVIFVM